MGFLLRNISGAALPINDLGVVIATGADLDLTQVAPELIAISSITGRDLETEISGGGAIVLDPDDDVTVLSIADSLIAVRSANLPHYRNSTGQTGSSGAGCRVRRTASQTISNLTATLINFTSEDFDTDAMHDVSTNNERITFNTAGKYVVGCNIQWGADGAAGRRAVTIIINGTTTVIAEDDVWEQSGNLTTCFAATVYDFVAADYIECEVFYSGGATLDVASAGEWSPTFFAHQVDAKGAKGDTGATGGGSAPEYIQARDAAGGQAITGTAVVLNLDTIDLETSGDFTLAADAVTFNNSGDYSVEAYVTYDDTNTSGGARCTVVLQAQEDVGAGFVDITDIGRTLSYHRESTENTVVLKFLRTFAATDDLRIRLTRQSGSTNIETEPGLSRLIITKVG